MRICAVAFLLASGTALAEGNVRVLDCTVIRSCDAAGSCQPGAGAVTFQLSPQSTNADGSGRFAIRYGPVQAIALAQSETGPFFWESADGRHTLLAGSETDWLWHQLVTAPTPTATIRFLACRYRG